MKPTKLGIKGQGLTEYLILVVLIGVVSIGIVSELGTTIKGRIKFIKEQLTSKVQLDT